jgi:hypothetical protein
VSQLWTNQSVLKFASGVDPVFQITAHARRVALNAMDSGWAGPPFDPVDLAELLKIPIRPTDAVRDARTVPIGKRSMQIEFNPNRPRGRVRFSVAHEIAHTFFPDCADQIRNRSQHSGLGSDAWQLEALCNVAAAELLMPIAAISLSAEDRPDVERLLQERERFDVSMEALLIRVARASAAPIAMFVASQVTNGRYRIDYVVPSVRWKASGIVAGLLLPAETMLSECTGIGFTVSGDEVWGRKARSVHFECVGIPPYPGGTRPRVSGLVWSNDETLADSTPVIRYARGDAANPRVGPGKSLIVHLVNDATPVWGGAGFAVALKRRYPLLQRSFKDWWMSIGRQRLGRVHTIDVAPDTWVSTIIAQHGFGPSTTPRIRYAALFEGLQHVAAASAAQAFSVQMPRLGTGQAGGRWPIVEDLIRDALGGSARSIVVYDLPGGGRRGPDSEVGMSKTDQPSLFAREDLKRSKVLDGDAASEGA